MNIRDQIFEIVRENEAEEACDLISPLLDGLESAFQGIATTAGVKALEGVEDRLTEIASEANDWAGKLY